jgi:hypothetical protein
VARKQTFLRADFSDQFKEAYAALQIAQQNGVDKAVMALLKQQPTPGMRVKPIEPDKYYDEARINDGDRLVHRTAEGTVYFVDVVKHDDIDRYGRAPKQTPHRVAPGKRR